MFNTTQLKRETPRELIQRIGEENIFEKYLGINPKDKSNLFKSPLRKDNSPSCSFTMSKGGVLYFHDFAYGLHLNSVGLVMHLYGLTESQALTKIQNDFSQNSFSKIQLEEYESEKWAWKPKQTKLEVFVKKYTKEELDYWHQYNISTDTLKKFNVFSVDSFKINDFFFKNKTIRFAYFFKEDQTCKLYTPHSEKYKWMGNMDPSKLQGWEQNKDKKIDFITSSLKDVMCLEEIGYTAIAPHGEGYHFSTTTEEWLNSLEEKPILFYDNDSAGRYCASQKAQKYKLNQIFTDEDCKDPSDYSKKYGKDNLKRHVERQIMGIVSGENDKKVV